MLRLFRALWLVCPLIVTCQPVAATQVIVRFAVDSELRPSAARLRVRVTSHEGDVVLDREKSIDGRDSELARVPIVPRDEDASRSFGVQGELFDAQGQLLGVERAESRYIEHELGEILLVFDAACTDVGDCGEGRRCAAGACVGSCVAPVARAVTETPPRCQACERCRSGRCEPLPDGNECGCAGDRCEAGSCVVARPIQHATVASAHSCAVSPDAGAYCWGRNEKGQVGIVTDVPATPVPTLVLELSNFWRDIAAEGLTTCALGGDEVRHCWGDNWFGQYGSGELGVGSSEPVTSASPRLRELSAGGAHYCGLDAEGSTWCWGYNERGQLGRGSFSEREAEPARALVGVLQLVDAGGLHSCGIDRTGKLWCWGYNDSGQLGVGDSTDRPTPVRPGCEPGQSDVCFDDWVSVSGGTYHTCGIRRDGSLWCWGGNANAQLGVGTTGTNERAPLRVKASAPWSAVAAGYQHTCAIRSDGTLLCWGAGEYGQLGNGARERQNVPVAVNAPDSRSRWEQVLVSGAAGPASSGHTCAVRNDRTLWCWGRNESGQLGTGAFTEAGVAAPRRVCLPPR
ncbi:MAG TPA: hypothetical protein VK524_31920 [Polyangiaceae bacterium]|nr:hypothetical protein [Polyangiaceae bacterium]